MRIYLWKPTTMFYCSTMTLAWAITRDARSRAREIVQVLCCLAIARVHTQTCEAALHGYPQLCQLCATSHLVWLYCRAPLLVFKTPDSAFCVLRHPLHDSRQVKPDSFPLYTVGFNPCYCRSTSDQKNFYNFQHQHLRTRSPRVYTS